jgi:hypothetical protein
MPGHVPDDPADAVHLPKMLGCVLISQTFQTSQEFATGKTILVNERVSHNDLLVIDYLAYIVKEFLNNDLISLDIEQMFVYDYSTNDR